jgi:hypothetical protein
MKFATERLEIKPISLADQEAVLDLLTNETVGKTYMLPIYQNRAEAVPLFTGACPLAASAAPTQ